MLGCPSPVLISGAGVAPGGGPRQWSFSLAALCHRRSSLQSFSCHGKQSHHLAIHLASVDALASSPLPPVLRCYTVDTMVALAHSSPHRTGGYRCSARCKSSLVYQVCVLGQENGPLHTASGRALPTRVKRNPDVDIQSIGNLPESVSRKPQGSTSHLALPARPRLPLSK